MRFSSLFVILLLTSCSETSRLSDFDRQNWIMDAGGCNTIRVSLIDDLMSRKAEITGLGQEEVVELLGKPDMHELYSRNKKSFTYFIASGPSCANAIDNPPKLIIRFDGLGRSKDIIYYKE